MKLLLLLLSVFVVSNALLEFTDSFLYDMNDIKGTYDLPITVCSMGCRVYLTYLDDAQHLGDQDNGPMTIVLGGQAVTTFKELNKLTLPSGEKGYLSIPAGTASFTVHNPNGNAVARPLALWVVRNTAAQLDSVAVYEAANGAHIATTNKRVVLMSVAPFTAVAKFAEDYSLTAKPSPFDVLENSACEYVLKTDGTVANSVVLQAFNSPVISFLVDSKSKMTLDINFDFPVERSIDAAGYLASPGYIGCSNKTFRSESYNYGVSSINETFLVDGATRRHVSFYGDINTDAKGPVLLYDMDTEDAPLIIVGTRADHTSKFEHVMDTSSFSLHWDDTWWLGNGSFMIRYDVSGAVGPKPTGTVPDPTTSACSLRTMLIAVMSVVVMALL